jgi:MoaA/NifB/PqqE/SkfB family radical SAM enzyme
MSVSTYCPQLWDGVTIDNKGNVFSCCHIQPGSIGNIYSSKLIDLVNNTIAIHYRKRSLKGCLDCYTTCTLLQKSDKIQAPDSASAYCNYEDMTRIHLNFGERCNIACIMCKQPENYKKNREMLDPVVLIENIDITPFQEIVIQGGETLFIPQCLEYMDYLASRGKKYTVLTNGTLINEKMAEKLSMEAGVVSISINAATKETHEKVNKGSSWERVISNIRGLVECRNKNNSDLIIYGRMTLTVHSLHEIPLFLEKYQEMGFDKINFGFDKATVPIYLKNDPEFKNHLSACIQDKMRFADKKNIDHLRLEQLGFLG